MQASAALSPTICQICQVCRICTICRCINECICGPCNICVIGGGTVGGGGRFEGLG
jgi:hypothetical protein